MGTEAWMEITGDHLAVSPKTKVFGNEVMECEVKISFI